MITNSVSQFSSGLFMTAALEEERQTAFVQTRSLRHPNRRHIRDGNPAWVVSGEDYLELFHLRQGETVVGVYSALHNSFVRKA